MNRFISWIIDEKTPEEAARQDAQMAALMDVILFCAVLLVPGLTVLVLFVIAVALLIKELA